MIKRWQEKELKSVLASRRGAHLTGARQCGKTTLTKMVQFDNCRRYTFDDESIRNTAAGDPMGFINHAPGEMVIIDEVQKEPRMLEYIKQVIDNDNSKGQYLLTGSANLHFAKAVRDTLAGRLGKVRLRTLALGEILDGNGDFIDRMISGDLPRQFPDLDKHEVIHRAFCGGYPEAMDLGERDRRKWFRDYLDDLLSRDVQEVTEIRKLAALRKVSDWLLSYSSKFFVMDDLCREVQISKQTANAYLEALQALYLFDEVRPWTSGDYGRIGKRSKYLAADCGLMANVLGWDEQSVYFDDDRSGKLVESWVYHELASLADHRGDVEMYQYHDNKKREIDFVLRLVGIGILGVEVKAGSVVSKSDFSHLKWFKDNLCREPFTGIVLYTGSNLLSFGEHLFAVPMSALVV